ncbi:hypothetical protein MKY30_16160 [Oceanobacillus sp. FSL W8-0428]|uniref:hypothetical protein n=1 Tax=Oceanobacillus sp. FSL W8-0428 TaxID=2921715 RepID=UPI0030FA41D6
MDYVLASILFLTYFLIILVVIFGVLRVSFKMVEGKGRKKIILLPVLSSALLFIALFLLTKFIL